MMITILPRNNTTKYRNRYSQGEHGTATLSLVGGGNYDGKIVSPFFDADILPGKN